MTEINKTKDYLNLLATYLEKMAKKPVDLDYLNEFYDTFSIKDNKQKPIVKKTYSKEDKLLYYNFNNNSLNIDIDAYNNGILYMKEELKPPFSNIKDFECYLGLFMLLHELEHSYQGAIGWKYLASPSTLLNSCYDLFLEFCMEFNYKNNPVSNLRYILYNKKAEYTVIERNANIEALRTVIDLANLENKKEYALYFQKLLKYYYYVGYENKDGVIINTLKIIGKYKKAKGFNELDNFSLSDKVRYGMPLNDSEFKLLRKK